ncbi:class IV adenylate cyclase [candidate division KSB1 bacterium]
MYEIEAKVPLSKADFQRLKKEVPKITKHKIKVSILDRYYGNPKTFFLRIREKNGKGLLNLKSKEREQGIELNQEIELPLTSAKKFDALLKKFNLPLYTTKRKEGEVFSFKNFQIELHKVEGLGHFLEIETIIKSKSGIPKAKKALRDIFHKLGFSPKDFEKKYYLELLEETRKNTT